MRVQWTLGVVMFNNNLLPPAHGCGSWLVQGFMAIEMEAATTASAEKVDINIK